MRKVFSIVLLVSILLSSLLTSCGADIEEKDFVTSFFDVLGFEAASVTKIELEYQNQKVQLSESVCQDFLETLQAASPFEAEEKHVYTPSDYLVYFTTEDKTIPVTFYWFSGRQMVGERVMVTDGDPQQSFEYIDDRFDVMIKDTIYHFRFGKTENGGVKRWTEDTMRETFDARASQTGLKRRGTLDGFDKWGYVSLTYLEPEITWQELIEDADLVVVVTYLEQLLPEKKLTGWPGGKGIDQFRIDNILKGNIERETIELPTWYGVEVLSGNRYGVYPVCKPPYITGQKYLLVLKKDNGIFHEIDLYGTGGYSAEVEEGYLFPRYNTEHHPFYNVALEEIVDFVSQ